jgi:tripartite-type tricarboxylate transporter receptor subunit TctC
VGQASDTATNATFMNALFKTRFKVIAGYGASNKAMLAIAGGETQGAFTTWDNIKTNHKSEWQNGTLRPLLQIGFARQPELPDVPLVLELAHNDTERQLVRLMSSSTLMGQSIAAPPGVPDDILDALRRAFDMTMQDQDFRERMKSIGADVNAMTGAELADLVDQIMATPPEVIELYKKLG